jgi:hypothetical protein
MATAGLTCSIGAGTDVIGLKEKSGILPTQSEVAIISVERVLAA